MFDPQRILVLAPHTDDGELGCGAAIAKFCGEGIEVFYAAFSLCSRSLPAGLPSDTLEKECKNATGILGIDPSRLILFNYEVREFPASRQAILEEMTRLNKAIQPELVFLPAAADIHQDHRVIHEEGLRAFKNSSLAGYELPWNNDRFHTRLFIRVSEAQLEKKIASLKSYTSQAHRNYMQPEFTRSLARVRGVQAHTAYAEAFEVYKWLV